MKNVKTSKDVSAGTGKKKKRRNLGVKKTAANKNKKKLKKQKEKIRNNTTVEQNKKKQTDAPKTIKKQIFFKKNQEIKSKPANNKRKGKLQLKEKKNAKTDLNKEKFMNKKRMDTTKTTGNPSKEKKTEKLVSNEARKRQKILTDAEPSELKKEKIDSLRVKNLEDELDFSCLDSLCKYKMRIKRKRIEFENEETYNSNKKELKKKDKRREKEKLRESPEDIVSSSLFRYINEYMYKNRSEIVQKKLNESKSMFHIYHTGYKNQVNKWPNNPTQIIINFLKNNFTKNDKIADWGCGEAQIAQSLINWNIVSFDLLKYNKYVTVGNITKLDTPNNSYDCVVLSLSLMNTDWPQIIYEASRCLKRMGILIIAEVASRFIKYKSFFKFMKIMKFKLLKKECLEL